MGDRTKIEWADASWNPIRARNKKTGGVGHFCIHASRGCANCYAETLQARFQNKVRFAAQDADKVELFLDEDKLLEPLRWRRPRVVFVNSMSDSFLELVPDEWIDKMMAVAAMAPRHRFLFLTKRAERMSEYLSAGPSVLRDQWFGQAVEIARTEEEEHNADNCVMPLPNVWCGVSAEDQTRANIRLHFLEKTPAAVRFLSAEPLLGEIDLNYLGCDAIKWLDWVIVGGESGHSARPMEDQWVRWIRDACKDNGVSFFMKQMVKKAPIPDEFMIREWPHA